MRLHIFFLENISLGTGLWHRYTASSIILTQGHHRIWVKFPRKNSVLDYFFKEKTLDGEEWGGWLPPTPASFFKKEVRKRINSPCYEC